LQCAFMSHSVALRLESDRSRSRKLGFMVHIL
jgi:hypothetical protein